MKLTTLANKIKRENKYFQEATRAEKRVIIAKDCITRIKLEQLIANKGKVFISEILPREGNIKNIINESSDFQCNACAKGGLLMSYIGRINNLDFCDISTSDGCSKVESRKDLKKLKGIFTELQLDLIEAAFEGDLYNNQESSNKKKEENYKAFFRKYTSSSNRLIAICQNIIDNKGTFKL